MIVTDNKESASSLDQLLWEFKPESYIPHDMISEGNSSDSGSPSNGVNDVHNPEEKAVPVRISYGLDDNSHHDVLVNLCLSTPSQFGRFERVVEVVNQNKEVLDMSRKNYAFYKERGYPINTHKLKL